MSARIYSALLSLYPADLRHDFGEEMTQVFLEDLEDSRRVHGFRGAARVWWRSLKELCQIVLPAGASKREIAVPAIVFILQEFYLGGIMLLSHRDPRAIMPRSLGGMLALGVPMAVVTAVIAFIALRVGDRSVPVPLNLTGLHGIEPRL